MMDIDGAWEKKGNKTSVDHDYFCKNFHQMSKCEYLLALSP